METKNNPKKKPPKKRIMEEEEYLQVEDDDVEGNASELIRRTWFIMMDLLEKSCSHAQIFW